MPLSGLCRLALVSALTFALAGRGLADPPSPAPAANSLEATLQVQQAMYKARAMLRMDEPKKAVDVLEENLVRVNGNTAYLELLRDAYRAHVTDLRLKNQAAEAQRYLQRLVILDPTAGNDPTVGMPDRPQVPQPAPAEPKQILPSYERTHLQANTTARVPKIEVVPGVKAPVIRGSRQTPDDDPFDLDNRRVAPDRIAINPHEPAALIARGHAEFDRRRFAEARVCYEQFIQLDSKNIDQVRDRLAYCILDGAVEQLNRPGAAPLTDIRKQVVGAVSMAPTLQKTGDWLLKEIDQRGRTGGASARGEVDPPVPMQHFGKNPQGWMVTETANFRIFHNQNRDLVERIATIAERTRVAMSRKWLGVEAEAWTPKCELVVHASAADYSRLTNVPATSPGHSRIETDPTTFRVLARRIDVHVDVLGMLEAVLPHETTHVVLAGNFGSHQVPRWADEGVAVLTEPTEKIEQHRKNLIRASKEGHVMPVRELMNLANYPQASQISVFYAESVMLVDHLTQQRGPQVFTAFLKDGLATGYESALRKHYNCSFTELQTNFDQQVLGGQSVAARR